MSNALGIEEDYFLELFDLLNEVEDSLLILEKSYDDTQYKSINRCLHSLKGNCGMIGLFGLEKVFHATETHFMKNVSDQNTSCEVYLNIVDNVRDFFESVNDNKLKESLSLLEVEAENIPTENNNSNTNSSVKSEKEKPARFNLRIFHLDDEPEILEMFKGMLEDYGCNVYSFETLDDMKKEIMNGKVPDLFIIDFRMPKVNGNTILNALGSVLPKIPKVLLSGYISKENIIEALGRGALCVLEKPVDLYYLEKTLARVTKIAYDNRVLLQLKNLFDEIDDISEEGLRGKLSFLKTEFID